MDLINLRKAFKEGATLHGFLSGGGLRVFRVELGGDLIGYGEHPHALDALAHVELWIGEKIPSSTSAYKSFYGVKFPHYLTGSSASGSSKLDSWMCQGYSVDAKYSKDDGVIVVDLKGSYSRDIKDEPKPVVISGSGVDLEEALERAFDNLD